MGDDASSAHKDTLHRYLRAARRALVSKLDGLSDYDIRRPLVPTGTNLLGLVKHVASVESGYLAETFDRPSGESFPWFDDGAEANLDMWATPDESRDDIVGLYHRVWAHSDATIAALGLDSPGRVPWWGESGNVTLHQILVHVVAETNRHAGHADLVRELIDGTVGLNEPNHNVPDEDAAWWSDYHQRVQRAADHFR